MNMNRLLIPFLLLSAALFGQKPLALSEAVKLALDKNLDIRLAQKGAEIADKQENWGQAGFLPNVNASASYSYSQTDVQQQVAVGGDSTGAAPPLREFNDAVSENYNAGISASYVLFDGLGRINNWQKLQLQKEQSELQLRFTIENTLLQVISAYYNLARQNEQLEISREAIRLSLRRYERAQTAQELGSQSKLEALSALVDLRRDSLSYWNNRNAFAKGRRELNRLLNLPIDSVYPVDTLINYSEQLEYGALYTEALKNNAALVQAQIARDISSKNLNIAWSERMPEIAANAGYNFSRQENEGGFLLFTENTGWQYGLSAQWNLFSSYRSQTAVEVARIAIFQSDLSLEQARQQVKVDLSNAWLDYQNSRKLLGLEWRNLEVAQLNYQRSREAYALGSITNVQLREAQINYTRSRAAVNDLSYQLKLAEIELQRVAGLLLR